MFVERMLHCVYLVLHLNYQGFCIRLKEVFNDHVTYLPDKY